MASLITRNERERYLPAVLDHLLEFCDEVRVLDDASDDGTEILVADAWQPDRRIRAIHNEVPGFFEHEGRARQRLLEWTLEAKPTHVVAVDSDEFVGDGKALRRALERSPATALTLCMTEVWKAREEALWIRCDGGWRPNVTSCVWRVPARLDATWRIADKPAASGREPIAVNTLVRARKAVTLDLDIFHLGYANESERRARHSRYASKGGFGHNQGHVASILDPDRRTRQERREWPAALRPFVPAIVASANKRTDSE